MKKLLLAALAALCLVGCSKDTIEDYDKYSVRFSLDGLPWDETIVDARALTDGVPSPVWALVAKEGVDDIRTVVSVTDDDFTLSLPKGGYDVYVVAGLTKAELPGKLSDAIKLGKDVMVGHAAVTVKSGMSDVEITAKHIMSKLTLTVSNIPDGLERGNVWMRWAKENYTLDGGWKGSVWATVAPSKLVAPGGDVIVASFVDADGKAIYKALQLSSAILPGEDMELTVLYEELKDFATSMTWEDWNQTTGGGTLADYAFSVGDVYNDNASTVVKTDDDYIYLFAHKELTMTADAIKAAGGTITYNGEDWDIPSGSLVPNALLSMLQGTACPLAELNNRIKAAGGTEIKVTDTDVVAACTTGGDIYRYDFTNNNIVKVTATTGTFRLYPARRIGLVK